MKHLYIILFGLLVLSPAVYATGSGYDGHTSKAQMDDVTVTGKIIDEAGEPLPGATVQEVGTSNGTITDLDGNFSITVSSEAALTVSFIGYKTVEVSVAGKSVLGDITLELDLTQLNEVVVIGYGTQRKVDLTGSVAIVNAEEMKKISHSNISTTIQGKVAGVQVTTDGQPGADPSVRIRGIGSFGNTDPLYVVDGVIIGTTVRDFSPNDIESIQILKDASAAAIYGARAMNGVVIITTRQGQKNQPMRIDYNGYYGIDQVPDGVYDVMDAEQYAQHITNVYGNSGLAVPNGYDPNHPDYIDPSVVNTNWQDEAFKTGIRQNHNLNFSGGGESNTYNLSLDYFSQEGTIEGAGPNFDRYTARLNNTMEVKFVTLKTGLVYSHSDQDNMALSNANEFVQGLYGAQFPVMASALITPPSIRAYDPSTWVMDATLPIATQYTYDSHGYGTYYDDIHGDIRITNVLLTNNLLERNNKVDRILGSGSAIVDMLEMFGGTSNNHKLNYTMNMSYNRTYAKSFTFVPAFIQSTTNYLTKENERMTRETRDWSTSLFENFITYDGTFGSNHLNVVAGTSFQRNTHERVTGWAVNINEPYLLSLDNAAETFSESWREETVFWSYFGRLNYDFEEKYLFSATVRYDGASQINPVQNQEIYPSASVGWRLDQESFFPFDESLVNLFKVRASYGELGSVSNLSAYPYTDVMARLDYTYSFNNNVVYGSAISNFVNENIRWERKKTLDIGLDLGMFRNQLEFTFDYYRSESIDLIYDVRVPATTGATNQDVRMNASTMLNSGLEFLVAYHYDEGPVKLDVTANMSTLKNEVTQLGSSNEPRESSFSRTEVGREVGELYGYVYEGIFQSQDEIDNRVNSEGEFVVQNGAQPGDVAYADINNDGTINALDRTFLGSGLPSVNYGLNIRAEWKGIDLSIFAFGAAGFKAVDFVDRTLRGSYGGLNKSTELLNAWTPENPSTSVPRVSNSPTGSVTNDAFSARFIQDASYLKIANVQLGYNFPDEWFGNYIHNARVYVTGQNLAIFSDYVGYNVDYAGGTFTPGYNYASYPTPRTLMFGAQFSF